MKSVYCVICVGTLRVHRVSHKRRGAVESLHSLIDGRAVSSGQDLVVQATREWMWGKDAGGRKFTRGLLGCRGHQMRKKIDP